MSAESVPASRPVDKPRGASAIAPMTKPGKDALPIKLLHDRVLVAVDGEAGERRSSGGIVIPATAAMGKRLVWSTVVGVGMHVRSIEVGDQVLYEPEDRAEVELHGTAYLLMRERDVHAVASSRVAESSTGLYL